MLAYTTHGSGKAKVIVMHDWFCCSTSYNPLKHALDTQKHTYAFVDFRGYGQSKEIDGSYTLQEAASDVLEVASSLGWDRFHLVGHSMSGMVAQRIALDAQDKVISVVAIAPTPASGLPVDEDMQAFITAAVHEKDLAMQCVDFLTGNRLNVPWLQYKVEQWFNVAKRDACVGYFKMFSQTDFSAEAEGLKTPFLVLPGAHDAGYVTEENMENTFMKWYPNAELKVIQNAGHYPMDETPLYLATCITRYIDQQQQAEPSVEQEAVANA